MMSDVLVEAYRTLEGYQAQERRKDQDVSKMKGRKGGKKEVIAKWRYMSYFHSPPFHRPKLRGSTCFFKPPVICCVLRSSSVEDDNS